MVLPSLTLVQSHHCKKSPSPQCFILTAIQIFLIMTSFMEKHCGSSLSSWLTVDTLLISKLFTPFVPICSQFRLYICYLGEFVKNKTHRFSVNDVFIKRVYNSSIWCWYMNVELQNSLSSLVSKVLVTWNSHLFIKQQFLSYVTL